MEEDTGTLATLQQNHYYPFGMLNPSLSTSNTLGALKDNRYLYNGKEFNDDFDLNWYDYGARFYDAQIGRWHSVDPLVEYFYSSTPYNYCFNNPLLFIDPFGMDTVLANTPKPIEEDDVVVFENGESATMHFNEVTVSARRNSQGNRNNTRPMGPWEILVMELGFDQGVISDFLMSLPMHHLKDYLPADSPKNLFEKHDPYDNWVERLRERFRRNRNKSSDQVARESTGDQTNSSGRPVVADKSEKGDSIVVDVAIMFYESDSVLLQKKIIHKSSRKGRYISDPFVSPSNHDFRK
jgi:RHS repeat-associated protein